MANVPNAVEKNAENYNGMSRVHGRYIRQTDGRATAYSEREHEFTFAKKSNCILSSVQFDDLMLCFSRDSRVVARSLSKVEEMTVKFITGR